MPTILEQVQSQLPAGGECWIEELLIRGSHGGSIKGAHAVIGWRVPLLSLKLKGAPDKEEFQSGLVGPLEVATAADDPEFAELITNLNTAAVDTVAVKEQQLAELTAEHQRVSAIAEQLEPALAAIAAKEAEVATLRQEKEALRSEKETLAQQLATAEKR